MLKKYQKVTSEIITKNSRWTHVRDGVIYPNGTRGAYDYVNYAGCVIVIPINREGKIVLVRQYRYLFDEETIEFPAGKIDEGEGAEASARRELKEEVGYEADELIPLGELYLSVGLSNGKAHVFLARGLTFVGASPEDSEEFEYIHLSPEEIARLIARGEMKWGTCVGAWTLAVARGYFL